MTSVKPFIPVGPEVLIPADTSAPVGVAVLATQKPGSVGVYRVVNSGTTAVSLGWGTSGAIAQANSVTPTAGTPKNSITIAPGAVEILRFIDGAYFSGISTAAANVFISPGKGV